MTSNRVPRRRRTLALLIVLIIPALLVGADLVRDRGISRFHDNQVVQGPLRVEAARQWSSGRIPLWNPYKRAGAPLLADVAGALYPPNLLFVGSDATQRDRALDRVGALHHLFAAAAAYFLLCTLGLRREAVILGALVYSLNGFIVFGAARWVDLQNSLVWAPLILASVVRAEASRDRFWAWSGLGALAFALQISCGYPEYAFYTALLVAALGVCLVLRAPRRWRRGSAAVSVIGLGGAALAAPQLLTTLEAVLRGTRAAQVSYAEFVSHSLRSTDLIGLVLPVGPSDLWPRVSLYLANGALFIGVGAVAFCAAALVRPRAISLYALGLVLVGTLLALGENSPFGAIGYHVPGLNAFRSPMKHLFELTLGISMLGAIGVDRFLNAAPRTRYAVAGTALACAALAAYGSARTGLEYGASGAIGCLAFAGLALCPDRRVGVYAALVTTPLLLGLNRHVALEHLRAEPVIPEVRAELAARLRLGPTDRVLVIRDRVLRNPLVADRAVAWQIPAAHGAGPFLWAPLAAALEMDEIGNLRAARILRPDDATLDLLSVRTLLSPRSGRGPAPRERLLRELYPGRISEVPEFLVVDRGSAWPFARVVDRVECLGPVKRGVAGEGESGETESTARAGRIATLSCADAAGGESPSSGGRAELAHFAPGEVAVRARVLGPEPGLLVLSQPDYPGWVAAIDGQRAPIRRVSGLVQGIWLPPGEHRVELEYRPVSFLAGVGLASLAATGLGFMALRERRRKKPN